MCLEPKVAGQQRVRGSLTSPAQSFSTAVKGRAEHPACSPFELNSAARPTIAAAAVSGSRLATPFAMIPRSLHASEGTPGPESRWRQEMTESLGAPHPDPPEVFLDVEINTGTQRAKTTKEGHYSQDTGNKGSRAMAFPPARPPALNGPVMMSLVPENPN